MRFPELTEGRLIKRYKRFLADVELADGRLITAFVPNTGSLLGCAVPGRPVWLRYEPSPTRKYDYTWVLTKPGRSLVCVDTGIPNKAVYEWAVAQKIPALGGYHEYRREVSYGRNSRADLCCTGTSGKPDARCWVEVKSTTLVRGRVASFPDAVTTRGLKHLVELGNAVEAGERAVQLFFIQRGDCDSFTSADDIDPDYGAGLRIAVKRGVEVLALQARISTKGITIKREIPLRLP